MSVTGDDQGRRERLPWSVLAVLIAIGLGIVVAYLAARTTEERRQEEQRAQRVLTKGISCDAMGEAMRAFEGRDEKTFAAAVKSAEKLAIKALDSSDIAFGRAEKMALYLAKEDDLASSRARDRIEERLARAEEFCDQARNG